ncbi:hypothetical protein H500_08045 [Helicobacter pylori CG-IMSS-2012]|nr:hypothetical protein H500_08045 [Helicobacter pylori CG-IMSS-2012]
MAVYQDSSKGEIQMIKSIEIENYKNFKHLKMENFK